MDVIERDVFLGAVVAQPPRGLRCQAQQRLDRGRGLRARAQFQQLAQQRERDDHRGGLEVDADAAVFAERRREQSGRHGRHHAVAERRCHADADQRPHVGAAVADRLQRSARRTASRPTARPASLSASSTQVLVAVGSHWNAVAQHRQHHDRPRVSGSVHQKRRLKSRSSGIVLVLQAGHFRLQRHAADRTSARVVLADLRMHRAGVDRACRSGLGFAARGRVPRGIGDEPLATTRGAEVVSRALMLGTVRCRRRIDLHPAHRIDDGGRVHRRRLAGAA